MKKLNLSKALSELLAVSTIAISIAQGGTIIGGNISFHGIASSNSTSTQQVTPVSVTIQSEPVPSFSSVSWNLYQSYQDQNACFQLYGSTWNPQPQYVTIPQNISQVSITVEPYNSNDGVIATFPGSLLAGQTLILYVAPLYNGMYSYGINQLSPYEETIVGNNWYTVYSSSYITLEQVPIYYNNTEDTPYYYTQTNSQSCPDTFTDYSLTSTNIQNVTVELSNGTPLIAPDANGNYYVSNLASSSTLFDDGLAFYGMVTTPEYIQNESLYYTVNYLPPFYQAACFVYDPTNHGCLIHIPNGLPEVIITWQ